MKNIALLVLTLASLAAAQEVPVITWATPAPLRNPTPLGATQLNATANVPGTFVYNPPEGTVLAVGDHTVEATFTPEDTAAYTTATAAVTLKVIPTYWPYSPVPVYLCQMNQDMTPVLNTAGNPRCFTIPATVSVSIAKYLLTQTNGLNPDGSVAYKYPALWGFIARRLAEALDPIMDQYPPDTVKTAKDQADAALKAVDTAKAALLSSQ
jgi:hypothetical protein